jgi:hypothetical protein
MAEKTRKRVSSTQRADRATKYADALLAGNTKQEARKIAGYSTKSHQHPETALQKRAIITAAQERGLLRMQPGLTMADSAKLYDKISRNFKTDVDARIRARTQLDRVLGHEAPKLIEAPQQAQGLTQILAFVQTMGPDQFKRLSEMAAQT